MLFGDDGFGPAVAERLQDRCDLPSNAAVVNAGSAVRDLLFTVMLSEPRPRRIIVVDAIDVGDVPGRVYERGIEDVPVADAGDHSMHSAPTSRLLRDLHDTCGIEVTVISVQAHKMPREVNPGLSEPVRASIPEVCNRICEALRR